MDADEDSLDPYAFGDPISRIELSYTDTRLDRMKQRMRCHMRAGGRLYFTILKVAISSGHCDLVDMLLQWPDRRQVGSYPDALHSAAMGCHTRIIVYLLAHGSDSEWVDSKGRKPIDYAIQQRDFPRHTPLRSCHSPGFRQAASMSVAVLEIANQRLTYQAFHSSRWKAVFGTKFLDDLWNTPIECARKLDLPPLPNEIWYMIHEFNTAKDYYRCIL